METCSRRWIYLAAAARKHLRRVRSLERTLGWILAAAVVDAEFGHWEEAAIRFGAADQISDAIGIRIPYPKRNCLSRCATRRSFPWVRPHSRQPGPRNPAPDDRRSATPQRTNRAFGAPTLELRQDPLTSRELDALRLLAEGQSDQEIADALFISRATASRHIANMYRKLDVRTRAAAASYAHSMKIV